MEFVHRTYERLMQGFARAGYRGVSVREAFCGNLREPLLILRHDVEWSAPRALALAEIERRANFSASYYFRVDTRAYDPRAMHHLEETGFELGYHFNTLDRCHGDFGAAVRLFEHDVRELRRAGFDIRTACQHGNPRVKKIGYQSNADLLEYDPALPARTGLLLADAYLYPLYPERFMLKDLGIRWNPPGSAAALLARIATREWPVVYFLAHPDYWSHHAPRAMVLQLLARALRCCRLNAVVAEIRALPARARA
jgi:hypothetical protein